MRARFSTTATGFRRRDRLADALDQAGGEEIAVEVALEALLDAGPQDLDGDGAALPVLADGDGLVHLGDGGGRDRRAELREMIFELAAKRLFDRAARFRHAERRQAVLQVAEDRPPARVRSHRRGSPETGRA